MEVRIRGFRKAAPILSRILGETPVEVRVVKRVSGSQLPHLVEEGEVGDDVVISLPDGGPDARRRLAEAIVEAASRPGVEVVISSTVGEATPEPPGPGPAAASPRDAPEPPAPARRAPPAEPGEGAKAGGRGEARPGGGAGGPKPVPLPEVVEVIEKVGPKVEPGGGEPEGGPPEAPGEGGGGEEYVFVDSGSPPASAPAPSGEKGKPKVAVRRS